jgi:1-deoxy-D-xylulose-5-phosphate reductoisomerase
MTGLTILGSTGTIGVNTLAVVEDNPDRYQVVALTANRRVDELVEQCRKWQPLYAVMVDQAAAKELRLRLKNLAPRTEVLSGVEGLCAVARVPQTQQVMAGIVGAAGLLPTLAAAESGKRVLLANKESLVMSGQLFMSAIRNNGAELLPIDSEHNAIFQCMPRDFDRGLTEVGVRRILLTASGGPFRTLPLEDFDKVSPEQACAHPNWDMGRKISVDSATMMNKGLEVIEACWLFDTTPDHIQVVLHPQSVIHSLVEYVDGSVLAQLGNPDMRTPIAYGLAWPERIESGVRSLDLFEVARLEFERPDEQRFPCLRLARAAMQTGGTATAILNAANEEAVAAFLAGRIRFTDIPRIIEAALDAHPGRPANELAVILEDDRRARETAQNWMEQAA